MLAWLLLLTWILPSLALTDFYTINNNKVLQTCAYVSNAESGIARWFRMRDPYIKVNLVRSDNLFADVDVYTLIMGGPDMNKISIGFNPYYKVCDEFALNDKYCEHESDESNSKKLSLVELIDSGGYKFPIESFMLNTKKETDHIYTLDRSGIYCAMFLTSNIPDTVEDIAVEVEWVQSYGNLLVSDFKRLFSTVVFTFAYIGVAIVLSFLTYRKINLNENTSITINNLKFQKFTLQYKFILFFWAYGILYLSTSVHYILLNKYDYTTDSLIIFFTNVLDLALSTIVSVWTIYNLMLFSAGSWIHVDITNTNKTSHNLQVKTAKIIAVVLVIQMLIYDMEESTIHSLIGNVPKDWLSTCIYIEYFLIYILTLTWAVITWTKIQEKKLKTIYLITTALLGILFAIIILGVRLFNHTAQTASIAYTVEFIFTVVVAFLWHNVIFENNTLVLK